MGVSDIKKTERIVTVTGRAEQEGKADIAIWPLKFSIADDELSDVYKNVESLNQKITTFLLEQGFEKNEISTSSTSVQDKKTNYYYSDNENTDTFRYFLTSTITIYTNKVDLVKSTKSNIAELGKLGVAFSGDDYSSKTEYLFTKLNEIKPQMIELSTKNARESAIKFANDSNSQIGKIKSATQGIFSIEDRDSNTPEIKTVRFVSTVKYLLK